MRKLIPLGFLAGLAVAVVPALAADQSVGTGPGNQFTPNRVTIAPGDSVTIRNASRGFHNVKWEDSAVPQMPPSEEAWSTTRFFESTGTYTWICQPHADDGMRGTVVVRNPEQTGTQTTPTPPPPTNTQPGDSAAPRITSARAAATRRLFTLRLTLDEPARVAIRVLSGRRTVTRRTFSGRAGANRFRIRRTFPRGKLRARVVARDAAGNATRARSIGVRR